MKRKVVLFLVLGLLVVTAGCAETKGDDYEDAPDSIKDGSLDYQDYKEAGCPHLDGSLDQKVMEKCNNWIRNQSNSTNSTVTNPKNASR